MNVMDSNFKLYFSNDRLEVCLDQANAPTPDKSIRCVSLQLSIPEARCSRPQYHLPPSTSDLGLQGHITAIEEEPLDPSAQIPGYRREQSTS